MNNKISFLIIITIFAFPFYTQSQALDKQVEISQLLSQISELTKIVESLQTQLLALTQGSVDKSFSFSKDLKIGDSNGDVKVLQKLLNREGFVVAESGAGSVGNETNYFGSLTENAVKKLQTEYAVEILLPQYKFLPDGIVDENTRGVLNELIKSETVSAEPVIESISPASGSNGSTVTIFGSNFNIGNNTVVTSVGQYDVNSSDGKTLSFEMQVPYAGVSLSELQDQFDVGEDFFEEEIEDFEVDDADIISASFPVQISVLNNGKESNIVDFNVEF